MSLRVFGGATTRTIPVSSFTVPATITSHSDLSVTANVPNATPPKQVNVVTTATKTSHLDNPGTSSLQHKIVTTASQFDALRSAAVNTAKAFSLDSVKAADRASQLQQQTIQKISNVAPIVVDVVVIPK